jgi:hypothetical protein
MLLIGSLYSSESHASKVDAEVGICFNTARERQARRESEASSGSYGSYMSFEKISSKIKMEKR